MRAAFDGVPGPGTIWNSTIFTPSGGSVTVERNGEQSLSLQNDAIQPFGNPLARSAMRAPAAPPIASRYFRVLSTEPGRSGPVQGASASDVLRLVRPAATAPSSASSKYM